MTDTKLKRAITSIRRQVSALRADGYTIEGEQVETMTGNDMVHIYLRDRVCNIVCLQKHLFSLDEEK